MATCKQTAYEFIQDVFSPSVAVLCSNDVEEICAKNNLTFVQMLQPFCRLNTEATIRDPNNISCPIRNFRVNMKYLHSQPQTPIIGKKMMHDAVASNFPPANDGILTNTLSTNNYSLKLSSSTPWFEAYREVFFQVTSSSEHEFVHTYLSCIFVVSSSHQDPLSQINELNQQFTQFQSTHSSRWFTTYTFIYYILLHDVSSEDLKKAETVYQSMKSCYGSNSCHLLQINSVADSTAGTDDKKNENMPDPWSQFLPKYYAQNNINSNNHATEENHLDSNLLDDKSEFLQDSKESASIHHPLLYYAKDSFAYESSIGNSMEDTGYSAKLSKSNVKAKRHGICLTPSDMDRIKCSVQDFCIQGLIPFVEKRIRTLNEQVANRKGIHKTLFGVTKKFFGNKPGAQSPTASLNSVVYGPDAPELQVRKLGDLAFMFQLYEVAYQAYHNAKRDFSADQAWLHFAGASEMAALSVFMQNSTVHEYPMRYIESAITTYLHTCKLPELATRATFLSTECLKAKGLYGEAATQFVRMPNEADLASALCLEQAAYCYANCVPAKIRKYAFHTILAGHRFSKAGQRKHALRSYKQAGQVYQSLGWNFANNHINFTIGRLSIQLEQLESACSAFEPLLVSKCELPPAEQANYLKEYLFVLKRLLSQKTENDLPILPVPLINSEVTKVLLSEDTLNSEKGALIVKGRGFDRGDINNNVWEKLEEIVVNRVLNISTYHNQLQCLTNRTVNISKPKVVMGEIITLEVVLRNPLSVVLTIDDVYPLWTFTPHVTEKQESIPLNNEFDPAQLNDVIETVILPRLTFEPHQEKKIHFLLTPRQTGELSVKGIAYSLLTSKSPNVDTVTEDTAQDPAAVLFLKGKQCFSIKGTRLNNTAEQRESKVYSEDNRLNFTVLSPMAKLQVKFMSFPYNLFCGEVRKVTVELSNVGSGTLRRVVVASPVPGSFAVGSPEDGELDVGEDDTSVLREVGKSSQFPTIGSWDCDWMVEATMSGGQQCTLEPGGTLRLPFWFRGPDAPGDHDLDLLFYYESDPPHPQQRYRLLQFSSVLVTYPSISVQSQAMRSYSRRDKLTNFHPSATPSSLILSVEVENKSEELDQVSLVQMTCVSKDWCFMPFEDNSQRSLPVIHFLETLMLTLKANGFDPKNTVSSQNIKVFSHLPFGRLEYDTSSTPCLDFSSKSSLNLNSVMPPHIEAKSAPSLKECDLLRIEQDRILLLIIIWKAKIVRDGKDNIILGLHQISVNSLESSATTKPVPALSNEESPAEVEEKKEEPTESNVPSDLAITSMLKCSLKHPFQYQHDCKAKRTVTVPIEFIAHNTSDVELKIIIDTSIYSVNSNRGLEEVCNQSAQRFTWVSGSKREFFMKPHNSLQLQLQAMFCGPGIYDLGNLHVAVNLGKDNIIAYPLPPHLLVISFEDTT